jgi:hypothetical protein
MTHKPANLPASISGRLRNIAREKHTNLDFVLRRYAIERLLYRMSVSAHRTVYSEGAMLFGGSTIRSANADLDLRLRRPLPP